MVGLTYREVAKNLVVCDNYATCKRGFSKTAHAKGKIDRMGHLHWSGIDKHFTKAGLHNLLVLLADHHMLPRTPRWERIWLRETTAMRVALRTYHIRIPKEMTQKARNEAARWAEREHAHVRTENFAAYQWIYRR